MVIKSQNKRGEFNLRLHEVQALWNAADNFRDRLIIKTLYYTGLRRFELCDLRAGDIDFDKGILVVREGKGHKMRHVPLLNDDHRADMRLFIGNRTEGPFFPTRLQSKMGVKSVNHLVGKAAKNAGLKHPNSAQGVINPHLLRHTIARHLKSQGFTAEWIAKFLGHDSVKTTMDTYGTLSIDEMQLMAHRKLGTPLPRHLQKDIDVQEMRRLE